MIISLMLAGFAALVATIGARLLARASWTTRSPGWGIWAWQALSTAAAGALVLAGLVLAVAATPVHEHIAALVRVCSDALARHYAAPGGLPTALAALGISFLIIIRFGLAMVDVQRTSARQRQSQRDTLALVGEPHPDGYILVQHALPLVYCVPGGRTGTIVVTTGAVQVLSERQLDLVLAHERKHLRSRHHIALALSAALSRTFAGRGIFGEANERIAALAEMQADDAVHHGSDRRDLARALLSLTPGAPSTGAVLASTAHSGATARVHRLAGAPHALRRPHAAGAAVLGLAALALPLAVAAGPAVESAVRDCCPVSMEIPHTARK